MNKELFNEYMKKKKIVEDIENIYYKLSGFLDRYKKCINDMGSEESKKALNRIMVYKNKLYKKLESAIRDERISSGNNEKGCSHELALMGNCHLYNCLICGHQFWNPRNEKELPKEPLVLIDTEDNYMLDYAIEEAIPEIIEKSSTVDELVEGVVEFIRQIPDKNNIKVYRRSK